MIYFNGDGQKIKKPLSGFMSRLFQHELDHLDGKLMLENNNIMYHDLDCIYDTLRMEGEQTGREKKVFNN